MAQTYRNFELIIVDDGSTDGTEALIASRYAEEIKTSKIRYFHTENGGCGKARNYGLAKAQHEWIAYLDSDNQVYPHFLQTYANAIMDYANEIFYATWDTLSGTPSPSRPFDAAQLMSANFIDLGVMVHAKRLYEELGGFDENLTRLVDWELIIRYTKQHPPHYIDRSVMLYNDDENHDRISINRAFDESRDYIWRKHGKERI